MRLELLYNPRLLCERLATESMRRRRLSELRNTPASCLTLGHIDSLELLKIARQLEIDIIYDIGANVGTWSLLAKSLIPDAKIFAFEPLPKHQVAFRDTFQANNDIQLHPIALGSSNSSKTLHITDFSDASSILPPNEESWLKFGVREVAQLPVEVFRLDDYRRTHSLPFPDLLKLDIQGFEVEALRGGAECLSGVKAILVEVSFIEFYEGQCLFHEVVNYLAGFNLFVRALGVNTSIGQPLGQTDVLFLRPGNG